nr:LOB domain-containing protein 33-like [Tanacetum cinerariifolium]
MTGAGFSCGACKFLRRKCTNECVFTPYFCYSQGADDFAAVHKVFGASNVSKLLTKLPLPNRSEAAISISYEALSRMHDPIYGCVAQILALEQQVANLQEEIDQLGTFMAYASFGQSTYATLQDIHNPHTESPFSFEFNDTSSNDHLNQQTSTLFDALQASSPFEDHISHLYSFLDHPMTENNSLSRMHDPIYGCVAQIFALEQQVANLQEEIDQLGTFMAYASFGQSTYATLQDIHNPHTESPFSFEFNDTSSNDHLNQQTSTLFDALQASSPFEDHISHLYSFLDHPMTENNCNVFTLN